MEATGYF